MKKRLILFSAILLLGMFLFHSCVDDPVNLGNVVEVENNITKSSTWYADSVYVIDGAVYVGGGAIITILPGTVIKFNAGASLSFGSDNNATILARGTAQKPITFTSNAPSPVAGAWDGLYFYDHTLQNSVLKNCNIEFAGGKNSAALNLYGSDIAIDSCTISKSAHAGIMATYADGKGGFVSFKNNTFADIAGVDVEINVNKISAIAKENAFTKAVSISGYYESTAPRTWRKLNVPYVVNEQITIDGDLTIEAGTVFRFGAMGYMTMGMDKSTKLTAVGTSTEPILFTSDAPSPAAGAWRGLEFYNNTQSNTTLSYCVVEYAGKTYTEAIVLYNTSINFTWSTVRNCSDMAFNLSHDAGFTSFHNNTIAVPGHIMTIRSQFLSDLGVPNTLTPGPNKGIDVYSSGSYPAARVWKKQIGADFYVDDYIHVEGNLTIEPGCTFKMGANGYFILGSETVTTFRAVGDVNNPITFTSAAPSPAPGSWAGIEFHSGCISSTTFDYCIFNYGGKANSSTLRAYSTSALTINNSQINNHGGAEPKALRENECTVLGGTGNNFTWTVN